MDGSFWLYWALYVKLILKGHLVRAALFEYYDADDKQSQIMPYSIGTTHLFAPLKVDQPFCSFFDNRSPQMQKDLRNCTWYREVSVKH